MRARSFGKPPDPAAGARAGRRAVCLCLLALMILASAWPDALNHWSWDRDAIAAGQAWRLLTGHLVHLDVWHLIVNALGFWLIAELLWHDMPTGQAVALTVVSLLAVDLGLWSMQPDIAWYAGASGMLHGLWAGCALRCCFPSSRCGAERKTAAQGAPALAGAVGLLLLAAKLVVEQRYGSPPVPSTLSAHPVVTAAHLYGALGGALWWLAAGTVARLQSRLHRRAEFD